LQQACYSETFGRIEDAIAREKQLKKWNRSWKNQLISDINPAGTIYLLASKIT
jgi:putative endonuclease